MPILPNNDLDYIDEESEDITSEDMTDGSSVTENNATYNDPFDYNGPTDIGVPDSLPVDPVVPETSEDRYYVTYYNRGDLTDYEPAYLQELADSGCKFYAIYDDETEVEIQWTEIEDLSPLETEIDISASIAAATNQHFWDDTNGVHVAEVAKEDWQTALEAEFSDLSSSKNYYNILMNSLGLLLRRANFILTSINRASISFYDGLGNETTNIMASFGRNSAQIGRSNDKHVVIDNSGLTAYNSDGTLAPLTGTFDGANISNSSITNAKIVDGTIEGTKIASATIDNSNIKNGTIEGTKIASATIDNSNIKNGTITGAKIADGTIENTDIKNGTITGTKIAASTIENSNIKDGTIQGSKIVGSTLTGIPYAGISDADIEVARVANAEIAKAEVNYAHITNGVIDNAKIDHADVNGLSANYATVANLNAATARIGSLEAADVTINGRLDAAEADIDDLEAEDARIGNLVAQKASITDLNAATARIGSLEAADVTINGRIDATEADIDDLEAEDARIGNLVAQKASITDLNAATARIGDLEADHVSVEDFEAEQANIDTLQANTADIATIRANSAKVQNLTAAQLEADHATVGSLSTTYATIANLNAATGRISDLESTRVRTTDLEANYITADTIEANYTKTDLSNTDVAWIQNGTIKDGAISNAMIGSLSASKLTAGTINGNTITVTNLNADNITAGTLNGQRIGEGSLSLSKLEEDVYTESEVDSIVSNLQTQIDGAIETWTGTAVPTLNNSPASGWTTNAIKDTHVGDVYFVVNSNSQQNGYNYRFTKSGSTYSWQLIKDSDVTNALQRLSTAEGKITTFDSDISQLKTDTGTLTTKTTSLETRMTNAESDILDKVDTTTFNEVSDTVDSHSQSITQMSTTLSNKADSSTVTAVTNRVSKTEQDISGINTTIGTMQTTLASKADGSTVETMSTKLNTVSDTVDGHTQSISSITSTQTTMQGKLDKTLVETTQLWFSKANTTAPNKPTAQVTSTSTEGNAWRVVVPAYNASYPNYYYCYQWKYSDGTYGWSSVTRDIAMGESQERARTAITNAANAQADIDGLEIGGRNIARGTAFANSTDLSHWYKNQNAILSVEDGSLKIVGNQTTSTPGAYTLISVDEGFCTLSFWYKAITSGGAKLNATGLWNNTTLVINHTCNIYITDTEWHYYTHTFELTSAQAESINRLYIFLSQTDQAVTDGVYINRLKLEKGNRATDWTPAPEDVDAGISTAQNSANNAQATANKNVKESVQLWFTKANGSAPSKPTSAVTSTSTSGNAWTTKVPTYSASYPHYFYCMQYKLADGTYTWSDVVYDQATTEAQSVARTTSTNLSTLQSDYATFKQTTQNFESTIGTTYATKTEVSTVDNKIDNLEIGGRNLLSKSQINPSNWVHTIANTTTYTGNGYENIWTMVKTGAWEQCYLSVTVGQDTEYTFSLEYIVGKAYNRWSASTPLRFQILPDVPPNADNRSQEIAAIEVPSVVTSATRDSVTFTAPSDTIYLNIAGGYVADGTTDLPIEFNYLKLEKGNRATDWTPAPEDVDASIAAIPRMSKINMASRNFTTNQWKNFGSRDHVENWTTGASYNNSHLRVGDRAYMVGTISDQNGGTATIIGEVTNVQPAGSGTSYVTLKSEQLIFGGDVVAAVESRVTNAETSITQTNNQIALKANASDVYTKTQVDGKITQEVNDRNSAIEQSASAINLSVSQNYTTKTEAFGDLALYTPVEWLQGNSDRTSRIDTGYVVKTWPVRMRAVVLFPSLPTGEHDFWGNYAGGGTAARFVFGTYSSKWYMYSAVTKHGPDASANVKYDVSIEYDGGNAVLIVNGDRTEYATGTSDPSATATNHVGLFSGRGDANYLSHSTARIYEAQFYEADVLLFDFVPVKRVSDSSLGMLNLVDRVFHPCVGGAFTAGEELSWIEVLDQHDRGRSDYDITRSQAEFKVTTDGITSTVEKINSAKYLESAYSGGSTLANIRNYASTVTTFTVVSTKDARVGDVVYLKYKDSTRNCYVYIKGTVTTVNSATTITLDTHGYEDVLPVDTIKSTINQSSDSVKIQAKHVEIDGAAIFSNTAFKQAADAAYDAKGSASAVQTNLDNLEIGGRNLLRNSLAMNLGSSSWANGVWRVAGNADMSKSRVNISDGPLGQCYGLQLVGTQSTTSDASCYGIDSMPRDIGEDYIISMFARVVGGGIAQAGFALNSANIEDTNTDGRWAGYYTKTLEANGKWTRIWVHWKSTASSGNIYIGGAATDSSSKTIQMCLVKIEKGTKVTDWTVAPEDVDADISAAEINAKNYADTKKTEAIAASYANMGFKYKKDIVIYGESSKYYPVYLNNDQTEYSQASPHEIVITRGYSEQAPSDWNTATHKGSLNLRLRWNYGGWGGATYVCQIYDFSEMYSTMLGDVLVGNVSGMCSTVYLRGGGTTGAIYHIYSEVAIDTARYGATFPYIGTNTGEIFMESGQYNWKVANPLTTPNHAHILSLAAVVEEQYIYRSAASGTTSMAVNETWVTANGEAQNVWTTKRPTYSSSYPVLFVAKQRKTAFGLVTCTAPVKDDTTTIIDGGHITTGTIDTNRLNADTIKSNIVQTTELNASKITSGTIDAARIAAGSIAVGKIDATSGTFNTANIPALTADHIKANVISAVNNGTGTINADKINASNLTIRYSQLTNPPTIPSKVSDLTNDSGFQTASQVTNSINAISIGGRNLFKLSDTLPASSWVFVEGSVTNGIVSLTRPSSGDCRFYQIPANGYWSWEANTSYVASVEARKIDSDGRLGINPVGAGKPTKSIDITTEWKRYEYAFMSAETVSTGSMSFYNNGSVGSVVEFRYPKLEKGTKATDWTPAPEDVDASIASVATTANNAAPKTSAVAEEQYIYRSATSGTTSMAGTTTWVTAPTSVTASTQNAWTTKRPEYSSSYPVLFIAKQRKTVDGTVTCTTPVKDDTTTIIDGGRITTGTIDADRISTTVINAINANVSDTINANKINASNLSIGYSQINNPPSIPTKVSQLTNDSNFVNTTQLATKSDKTLPDTRNDNQPPSWYISTYPRQSITEFKFANKIGFTSAASNVYCTLTTIVPWNDASGGYPTQSTIVSGVKYYRVGTGASTWSDWSAEETAAGAQAKADSKDDAIAAAAKRTDVAVAVTAINYDLGTATLQATLYIDGTATTSNVTYKWLKDGSVISGQTARTLSVTAAMGLSHIYSCTVTYS